MENIRESVIRRVGAARHSSGTHLQTYNYQVINSQFTNTGEGFHITNKILVLLPGAVRTNKVKFFGNEF